MLLLTYVRLSGTESFILQDPKRTKICCSFENVFNFISSTGREKFNMIQNCKFNGNRYFINRITDDRKLNALMEAPQSEQYPFNNYIVAIKWYPVSGDKSR